MLSVTAPAESGASLSSAVVGAEHASPRPNIVFILADDLGFTDLASYGGEVSTPNLDALAQQGIRFTNYHTAANCAPARAMLLTGVSSHRAGVPNIPELLPAVQRAHPSYQGVLGDNVVTVATLLEDAGYHTYMAGKWHLGSEPEKRPSRRGFERTVALMDSGADNWEQRPYLPIYTEANWYADGQRFDLPENFYSSRFLVDKTIEFIDSNADDGQPFFAYLPFQAVHIPVQAPQVYIDRYMGVYDAGWDALRAARHERAIELGIVPASDRVRMSSTGDWDALSEDRQRYESKRMAVYAAMIEAMDANIGRLVAHLREQGALENTVFIFTSDNGAEASGPADPAAFAPSRGAALLGYHQDYERLGLRGSYNSISPSFASAAASPLSYYKFYAGEGGMRVPLIIAGNPVRAAQSMTAAFAWATDITPTILSLAGVVAPDGRYGGRPVEPISGRNLLPLIAGDADQVRVATDVVGYELTGHGVLFQGDYKLLRNQPPMGDGAWYLYDIVADPGEVNDLKQQMPLRFQQMLAAYEMFERNDGVLPMPSDYLQARQLLLNMLSNRFADNVLIAILTLLVLLPFFLGYRQRRSNVLIAILTLLVLLPFFLGYRQRRSVRS
jgi:arylsulfatase/uncharacterized sulfatase